MQIKSRYFLAAALSLAAMTERANAYHLFYVTGAGGPVPVRWQTFGNVFTSDTDGPAGQNFTTLCITATGTWNATTDARDIFGTPTVSTVNFTGANINTAWGNLTGDGKYELVYDADGSALTALGLDPTSVNGYGPSRKRLVGGQGVIDDAFFVVTGTRSNFDLLSTLIHELGHIQGLAHSTVGMHTSATPDTALDKIDLSSVPTMHPFSLPTGNTSRRSLEPDDMAALRELYPEDGAAGRWASIAGEVKRCGSSVPVVGANVRLISTTNPNVQISRFTSYDGNSSGRYVINYIPAGNYRVVVEPLGANGFSLNRFGSPPNSTETDFDFEYLSPSATELACTEQMPEASTDIATVAGSNGVTTIGNDFRVGAPDLAFVVDDTGSMSEEIAGVRSILNATINTLAAITTKPFPLTAIVTFKDDVTKRIVSNNPANLRTVVNSLFASGGDDCPEASNAALIVAGGILKKDGVALLFTDADSRPDGPARSTVESLYRSKGVRLFTLLSGTCSGSITTFSAPRGAVPESVRSTQSANGVSSGKASVTNDEYPAEPVLGTEPGVTTFSTISNSTGGFFVSVPGINSFDTVETARYINVGTNLAVSAVIPAVALVTPTNTPQASTLNLDVTGSTTNFIAGKSTVSFSGMGLTVNSVSVTSPTRLTVNLTLSASATLGFRDITVTTDLGGGTIEAASGIGVINVTAAPTTPSTLSASPSIGAQGQTIDVTISGGLVIFTSASVANFGTGVTVLSNQLINATTLLAHIQIGTAATIGYRRVSVTTPGSGTTLDNSPTGAFQVTAAAPIIPIIQSLSPAQLTRGTTTNLTVVGSNTTFDPSTIVTVGGTGVTVNSVVVISSTSLTANITVNPDATLGFRDVTAVTGGVPAAILDGLQILAAACVSDCVTPLPGSIRATTGVTQSAIVNTAFSMRLQATLTAASGASAAGVAVTFTAPSSGASGTFAGGGSSVTVSTDASGIAISPVFTANGLAGGPYSVTASASGISSNATFSLTNLPAPKITPVISWVPPVSIPSGQRLDGLYLNATANVPGTFVYTPAAGTILPVGVNTLSVAFNPTDTLTYSTAFASVKVTVYAVLIDQVITFPEIPDHRISDAPFVVNAFSTSRLPVVLTVSLGPATISGNIVTLTGTGRVAITASQPGDSTYSAAPLISRNFLVFSAPPAVAAIANAATVTSAQLVPGGLTTILGSALATQTVPVQAVPYPSQIGSFSVGLIDSMGAPFLTQLYSVSPTQVTFYVPAEAALGDATLRLNTGSGQNLSFVVRVTSVSPGLYTSDGSGKGTAAGQVSISGDQLTGVLYGTGMGTATDVKVMVAGQPATVTYVGPQTDSPGRYQINFQLPDSSVSPGQQLVVMTVNGVVANPVYISKP